MNYSGKLRTTLNHVLRAQRGFPFACDPGQRRSEAVLIHVPTSDGSGEACHPSVLEMTGDIAGFRFWMANTPYRDDDHKSENPEVFASTDGLFWHVPSGLQNPIVAPPAGDSRCYHSDPCLLEHESSLWLYYRLSDERRTPRTDQIKLTCSKDGRNWSSPVTVLEDRGGALLLSPSVVATSDNYLMWTVDCGDDGSLHVTRRRSSDGRVWTGPTRCNLHWPAQTLEPWHIEVRPIRDRYSMVLTARVPGVSGSQRWHLAKGDGIDWVVEEWQETAGCEFEAGKPYKASLLPPTPERPNGLLYTSSRSPDGRWYTALRPAPEGFAS